MSAFPDHGDGAAEVPSIGGYRIHSRIGQAGQGVTWRAIHFATGRDVAIMLFRTSPFSSQAARTRIGREVSLVARLNHPNIVAILDSGLYDSHFFCVSEYIDGVPLDEFVRANQSTLRDILVLLRQACLAIHHAHQRGVIHGDIKPGNILVTSDGQPHVLDFGIIAAAVAGDDGLEDSLEEARGTRPYMSPEMANTGGAPDARNDIYALAVILYHLLTGQYPHDLTGGVLAASRRIAEDSPRRHRDVCRDIDGELDALLMKALARRPEDRYQSAGELAADIDNYLRGEPLLARRHTVRYLLARWLRKHRLLATLAAAAAMAAIVAAILLARAIGS